MQDALLHQPPSGTMPVYTLEMLCLDSYLGPKPNSMICDPYYNMNKRSDLVPPGVTGTDNHPQECHRRCFGNIKSQDAES